MNVYETLANVLQTNAAVEVMNEIVLASLKNSRDTCFEMRELLEAKRGSGGHFTRAEDEDWESLVLGIVALNCAIDYYGGY